MIMARPPGSDVEEGARLLDVVGAGRAPAAPARPAARAASRARTLSPKSSQDLGPRADEDDAGLGAAPGEGGVLAQEAVAGMNRIAAGLQRHRDDLLGVEVWKRTRALEGPRLVRLADVERGGVVLRIDGDGADAELGSGAQDSDRDLATVGDQK